VSLLSWCDNKTTYTCDFLCFPYTLILVSKDSLISHNAVNVLTIFLSLFLRFPQNSNLMNFLNPKRKGAFSLRKLWKVREFLSSTGRISLDPAPRKPNPQRILVPWLHHACSRSPSRFSWLIHGSCLWAPSQRSQSNLPPVCPCPRDCEPSVAWVVATRFALPCNPVFTSLLTVGFWPPTTLCTQYRPV
jgi:hypothetical protein